MIKRKSENMHRLMVYTIEDERKREKCDVKIEPEAGSATQRSWRGSGSDAEVVVNTKAKVNSSSDPVSFILWCMICDKSKGQKRGKREDNYVWKLFVWQRSKWCGIYNKGGVDRQDLEECIIGCCINTHIMYILKVFDEFNNCFWQYTFSINIIILKKKKD